MKLLKLVPENTNIDFMRWRNLAVVLSTLLTILSFSYTAYRGLNLGVDFVGGQVIRVTFVQPVDVEQLRGRVDNLRFGEASIQEFGGPKSYQIRLPKPGGPDTAANVAADKVKQLVTANYPGARVDAVETVSGKVSEELARDGALAIALAMLGIAIYIWFRFEWQFGVGALVTLAARRRHDAWAFLPLPGCRSTSTWSLRSSPSSVIRSTTPLSSTTGFARICANTARWRSCLCSTCH